MGVLVRSFAALALALTSCASVTFDRQEVTFDRDPVADSLTLELVYHDVGAVSHKRRAFFDFGGTPEGPDAEAAANFVMAVAAGEPVAVLLNPYGDLLLGLPSEALQELAGVTTEADLAGSDLTWADIEYLRQVRVVEARVELDDQGRVDLVQRIVYPDLSHGVDLANAAMRRFLLGEHQEGATERMSEFEASTYAIALADAHTGRDWLAWGDGGLVLRIPMDSRHLVQLLQDAASEVDSNIQRLVDDPTDEKLGEAEASFSVLAKLVHLASDLRVEPDHLVLVLGDGEGDLTFTLGPDLDGRLGLEDFRPALRDELEARGFSFPSHYALPE